MKFVPQKRDKMTILKNKKTLQNKDIIEKEKENFAFVDPIYRLWFKEEYCWELSLYDNVRKAEMWTAMLRFLPKFDAH